MADMKKMTKEQLTQRIGRYDLLAGSCTAVLWGAMLGLGAAFFWGAPGIVFAYGIPGLMLGNIPLAAVCHVRDKYKAELNTRPLWPERVSPAVPPASKPEEKPITEVFNPASATILAKDMRSMTPLRLKRQAGFAI